MKRRRVLAVAALLAAALAGCSTAGDETMFAPATTQPVPAPPTTVAPPSTADCTDGPTTVQSYAPVEPLPAPARMPDGTYMRSVQDRGRLVVGVSADTFRFGARNPISGRIEGFDIDLAKQVALAIFGGSLDDVEEHIEYRVLNSASRIPSIQSGDVDLVVRTMTINCRRWQQIAFSTQYFAAGQDVLVRDDSEVERPEDLGGLRVCAATGSTNLDNIRALETAEPIAVVEATDHTDCLAKFQQGDVDAVTSDNTILAGFAAQDPYVRVLEHPFSSEPYGIGISLEHPDFVRFVNGVLERVRADGTWTAMYERWIGDTLGPVPSPPPAAYGRQP